MNLQRHGFESGRRYGHSYDQHESTAAVVPLSCPRIPGPTGQGSRVERQTLRTGPLKPVRACTGIFPAVDMSRSTQTSAVRRRCLSRPPTKHRHVVASVMSKCRTRLKTAAHRASSRRTILEDPSGRCCGDHPPPVASMDGPCGCLLTGAAPALEQRL